MSSILDPGNMGTLNQRVHRSARAGCHFPIYQQGKFVIGQ